MTEKPGKRKQPKVSRLKLRESGGLQEPEKPRVGAGGIEKLTEMKKLQ